MWPILWVLGCAPESPPVAPAPAPQAAPAAVDAAPGAAGPPMVADQAPYGDHWLVILGSYPEPGQSPASLATLQGLPELGAAPLRLDSSRFKALQPCFEVVVAGAFAEAEAARSLGARLQAAGVEHYLKNAGAHVGRDPRVEAYCAADAASGGLGPALSRFAIAADGRVHIPLLLDAVGAERALEGAPPPRALDDRATLWSAALSARSLGDAAVGDAFWVVDVARGGSPRRCAITGFAALTRGQPHFAWYEAGAPSAPGCGEPEVFARTDCEVLSADDAWLAVPDGSPAPHAFPPAPVSLDAAALARADAGFQSLHADLAAQAASRGVPLQEHWSAELRGALLVVEAQLVTGEGLDWCGGEDLHASLSAVYAWSRGQPGALLLPWQDTSGLDLHGVADFEGQPALVGTEPFGGRTLLGAGAPLSRLERAYCDCPC